MNGQEPLGLGDATTALAELADLAELEDALRQDYPGARLDDVDEEAIRRALGRQAVDDMEALRQIEAELERQGYLKRPGGKLELTPKAVRRLGETALRRVFAQLPEGGHGDHDQHDAGQAGELHRAQPAVAVRRRAGHRRGGDGPQRAAARRRRYWPPAPAGLTAARWTRRHGPRVRLSVDDFEVVETERRTAAAVCLLVDLSYSMALRGTWGVAKQTALALHALVATKYPQDAMQIIGFSNYARELHQTELAALDWDMVQGTNLHHALLIAGRYLDRHPSTTRSCWSSPTASRPRTCSGTGGPGSTGRRPGRRWSSPWPRSTR